MTELQTIPPNPYEPSTSIDTKPIRTRGYVRIVASVAVFLIGLGVFGAGAYGTSMTIKNVLSNTSAHRWPTMIAVSLMYLVFGLSFFASSVCIFLHRTGLGRFFFLAPVAVFGTLLVIFGV